MAEKTVVVSQQYLKPIKILKWKMKQGFSVSIGSVVLLYDFEKVEKKQHRKFKSPRAGTICKLIAQEGAIIQPGGALFELEACSHSTVMKDMCAECGADLRKDDINSMASVPMIHSVPELKVSEELAQKIGKADGERLLKDKKLVLLVDLDQTLIHTTNDIIPPNLRDVYHFQLYGPNSPWYHTRLRPGTQQFLNNVSPYFELHICTFGARNYAHKITAILDASGQFFSNRVLSRDECFNPTSKTANLKALFPCGDHMVCIIDDREDVWSHASNLIHVKPYHFFKHTGDINAPPGLEKDENDEIEGVDLSKCKSIKAVEEKTDRKNNSSVKIKDENNAVGEVNPTTPIVLEKTGLINSDTLQNNNELSEVVVVDDAAIREKDEAKPNEECLNNKQSDVMDVSPEDCVATVNGKTETDCVNTIAGENSSVEVIHENDKIETKNEVKEVEHKKMETTPVEDLKKPDEQEPKLPQLNQQESKTDEINEQPEINLSEPQDCNPQDLHQGQESGDVNQQPKSNEHQIPKPNELNQQHIQENEHILHAPLSIFEIEDPDDYLLYLEDILKRIHKAFYDEYDEMESGDVPDLKKVIPNVKGTVLSGCKMIFSGLVPTHIKLEHSRAYQVAKSLGAKVTQELENDTTHLVAVRPGTAKVNAGRRRKNLKIVTPDWLWACAERWEHVDENIFPLNSKGSKNRHPPPHCSSPEHISNYAVHDTPAVRKRTPSGRFMDTINPLMSFSSADIADMDKEVEDILDAESESEEESPTEIIDITNTVIQEKEESSSSSGESLTAEMPRGHKRNLDKRQQEDEEGEEDTKDSDEFPSTKFRRGEQLDSDLDIGQDSNSEGSVEAPDEIDDGEWNMMGAALEREFLSNS